MTISDRTCSVPGCVKLRGDRQRYCPMHSARWRKYKSFELPERQPKPKAACSVDDCAGKVMALGLCQMHYWRFKRNGRTDRRPFVPYVNNNGYRVVGAEPDHVLIIGRPNFAVYEHRLVLFETIGLGPHRCHWCERHVNWRHNRCSADLLEADHLDSDRLNNAPSNLVPSCHGCNTRRAHQRRQAA